MVATIYGAADRAYAFIPVSVQTANYTAAQNQLVPVNATSGAVTVTLPTAPPDETVACIKKVAGSNNVTVATGAGDVFNVAGGPTTWTLALVGQSIIIQYSAAAAIWYILGDGNNGTITGNFSASGNGSFGGTLAVTGKSTFSDQITINSGDGAGALFIAQFIGTNRNPGTITQQESASGNGAYGLFVTGDSVPRFTWMATGAISWGSGSATQDVTLGRSGAGVLSVTLGSFSVTTAGQGLRVKEGSNAKQGTATLSAGTVTVSNTSVTSSSRIFVGTATPGGTVGAPFVSSVTAGTGFTIKSTSSTDTSVVAYEIFEPA